MKTLLAIIASIVLASAVPAADPPTPTPPTTDWVSKISVSPFGSVSHTDFEGAPTWGAGADIGYHFNKTLSLHGSLVGTETDNWGGTAIDETSVLLRGNIIRFYEDRATIYLLGSADRYWETHKHGDGDWGFGMGAGLEFRFTEKFSIGADYRIRAKFEQTNDDQVRGFFRLKF